MSDKVKICGAQLDNVTMAEALDHLEKYVATRRRALVVAPNVDHLVRLRKDAEFRAIYDAADLVLPDGMPLLWAALFLGTPLKEKISGSDLFPAFCRRAGEKGYRIFLLGGRPGAADGAASVIKARYPGLIVAGTYCPYVGFENDEAENRKIIALIRASRADALFVGLGSPKQEKWLFRHRGELDVAFSFGIGVTFEFVAGIVKRAPRWMQRTGFEWLWRLLMEPRRLWKRYLVDDPLFFWFVLRQRVGR